MNEGTSLFGNAKLQIELKPHTAVEGVAELREGAPTYKARKMGPAERRRKAIGTKSET